MDKETVITDPIKVPERHIQGDSNEKTDQNARNEQFKLAERVDDEETKSCDKLLDLDNELELPPIENASEKEDEQNLMPTPVYQKTCEILEKKQRVQTTAYGSLTSLKSIKKIRNVNCRTVLWYVTFVGFMVNYVYRININIAIVEMVSIGKVHTSIPSVANASTEGFSQAFNTTAIKIDDIIEDHKTVFAWNELQQSRVLGSFFWFHWVLQIAGGVLAPRYGTKLIFGLSNFISCFLCFFIPMAAKWNINLLIALRIVQGTISSLAWPAMHHLSAQWIPPNERGQFLTSYLGSSVCIAVFYPLFGVIMSFWSWESVFYVSGVFGTIWYVAWLYFVYDSPDKHPRIDPKEKLYIQEALSDSIHVGKQKIPWASILRSKAVWVNVIGQFGGIWGLFTMMTQAPTYFRLIHGWNVQMTGLLSGIPHLCRMIFAFVFSIFLDSLLKNQKLSRTNARRFAGGMSTVVNGLFVIGLAYSGSSSTAAIVFLTLSTAVHGTVSSGQLASLIDISPNFSGITLGLNGMICVCPGFISPFIVGILTYGNQTIQQWQYVFLICAGVLLASGVVYVLFADSTLQSWNQPKGTEKVTGEKEMRVLRKDSTNIDLVPLNGGTQPV